MEIHVLLQDIVLDWWVRQVLVVGRLFYLGAAAHVVLDPCWVDVFHTTIGVYLRSSVQFCFTSHEQTL